MLYIKHLKPIADHLSGKWTVSSTTCFFHIIVEGKAKEVTVTDDIRNYIMSVTINNYAVKGIYDKKFDSIIYTIDLNDHNLEVEEIKTFDNMFLIKHKKQ